LLLGNPFDAILIPGGGLLKGGRLPVWTKRRLDKALEIRKDEYIITLSAGTVHKAPQLNRKGYPLFECVRAADYLMKNGLSPKKILTEHASYDTLGNAYFARVIHTETRKWRKLLVITSNFHLKRTQEIFQWVFSLDSPRPAYNLEFVGVADDGIDKQVLLARIKKEKDSLRKVRRLKKKITSLQKFHNWIFTNHGAYSAFVKPQRHKGRILESY